MNEEELDIFDEEYNNIGTDTYSNIHTKGLWHHTFHCWIVDPEKKRVLVILHPNSHMFLSHKFDVAIFGQMLSGEKVISGKREVEKNLGIEIKEEDLIKIGITKEVSMIEEMKVLHKVYAHSYFLKRSDNLIEYTKHLKNIEGVFEMSIADGLHLFSDKVDRISVDGFMKDGKPVHKMVSYDNFAPRGKSYLHRTLFLIDSWLEVEEWEKKYKCKLEEELS